MKSKDNPTIFVGSSKEGIKYAEAIENFYFNESFEIQPWYRLFNEPLVEIVGLPLNFTPNPSICS